MPNLEKHVEAGVLVGTSELSQLSSDGALSCPRGDGFLSVWLFFDHVQVPTLASCGRPVPKSSVHAHCLNC